MKRIFRFVKALVRYALYGNRVPMSEYSDRISTCSRCVFFDDGSWKCGSCGCYVDRKARMSTEKCPEYRWKTINKEVN